MDIRNIIHRSNNRTQIRKFSSGYMAKVIQYYRRYLGQRKLEEIIPSYMASFPHSLGLIHHIFKIKLLMAKKRARCCGPFSRPPHFHDQTSNGEKTLYRSFGWTEATWPGLYNNSRPSKGSIGNIITTIFSLSNFKWRKNGLAAAGLFQGHHIFTINLLMAGKKTGLLLQFIQTLLCG